MARKLFSKLAPNSRGASYEKTYSSSSLLELNQTGNAAYVEAAFHMVQVDKNWLANQPDQVGWAIAYAVDEYYGYPR